MPTRGAGAGRLPFCRLWLWTMAMGRATVGGWFWDFENEIHNCNASSWASCIFAFLLSFRRLKVTSSPHKVRVLLIGTASTKDAEIDRPWIWGGKRRWFNLLSGKCPIDSRHFPRNKLYSFSTRTPLSKPTVCSVDRGVTVHWEAFEAAVDLRGGTSANFEQVTSLFGEQPLIQDFTWGRC